MPTFEYRAVDSAGANVQGTMVGASLTSAATELEGRGLKVEHLAAIETAAVIEAPPTLEPVARRDSPDITRDRTYVETHVVGQFIGQVTLADQLFFFRQLGTMYHAGVGTVQSLETLSRQTSSGSLRNIIREMTEHAREGRPLTYGMSRHPEVFQPLILSMIRVGEESGSLDETLKHVAGYLEREIKIRNMIRRQTLYPKVVLGSSIVIIIAANYIIGMVGGKGTIYSPLTEPATWIVLGPLVAGLFLFVKLGLPNPQVKANFDAFILGVPYLGPTVRMMALAKFSRAMAALYRGAVPLHKATILAADACGSEAIRSRLYPAAPKLEAGYGVAQTFAETGAVDGIVLDMIQTGEATGNLDSMLDKVADFYEDDSETRSHSMTMILGVVCLLLVAMYVLYILWKFYGNYFGALGAAANGAGE